MTRRRLRVTRALKHRNYRLYFIGQTISLVGTWLTRVATSWLVYRLTGSALLLGLSGFASQIPTVIATPLAGVLVDRWDRRRVLLLTQVCSVMPSAALATLTMLGRITIPEVLLLQAVQGVIKGFEAPARQALVVQMVDDRRDLANAIALNSAMVTGTQIIGPAIAGVLVAAVGEAWCFTADAVSYFAVIGSLLAMRIATTAAADRRSPLLQELAAGFRYAARSRALRTPLIMLALMSGLSVPYQTLMPLMASSVLHGGVHTLGILMTTSGVGALLGGLYLASRHSVVGLGRVIVAASFVLATGLIGFSLSRELWLSLVVLPLVGGGFMVGLAATNTVLQTIVDEELRGRVMAYYAMAVFGGAPLGSLAAGALAARIGAPATIAVGGVLCAAAGAWFGWEIPKIRPLIRPIYVARGIISLPAAEAGAAPP